MQMTNLGKRYASALLSIAVQEEKNEEYREYVKMIISILDEDDSLIRLLDSANLTKDEKKAIIDNVFHSFPYENVKNTLKVIIDNGRSRYIKDILNAFVSLSNAKDGISEGFIYSAQKLTKEEIERISSSISKKIGKKVYLLPKIDEELIGGFKIVIDDYVFDTSILHKIEELKSSLIERN